MKNYVTFHRLGITSHMHTTLIIVVKKQQCIQRTHTNNYVYNIHIQTTMYTTYTYKECVDYECLDDG